MERYIHRENLSHFRRLLAEPGVVNDQLRHDVLLKLLADEEAKSVILGLNSLSPTDLRLRRDIANRAAEVGTVLGSHGLKAI